MGKHVNPEISRPVASNGGRHRAEDPANPANTGQINTQAGGRRKRIAQVVVATGTMALVTATAAPASAPATERHVEAALETGMTPIVASAGKHVAFDRVEVRTEPAPSPQIVQAPREVEQNKPQENPAVTKLVPKKPIIVAPPKVVAPPVAPPVAPKPPVVVPPPVAGYASGAAIAAAALAQLGRRQDCTRLVTNSLAAVGIAHHGWPISYTALGTRVTDPLPGDLIYYVNGGMGLAHIAVYIGNGMAVHGGWNGNQTVTFKANVGSGPVYIRVRAR